jgi:hypothetical protein
MKRGFLKWVPRLVGAMFLYAAIGKLIYPVQAVAALESVGVRPSWAALMVFTVIAVELYLGAILILHLDLRWGLGASMGLMFAFAAFLCYLSTIPKPPACGCLGLSKVFSSAKHEAWFGLLRNCLILWALKFSYDYYFVRSLRRVAGAEVHPAPAQAA